MPSACNPTVKDYSIRIVKPCVDDPNYNTANAQLGYQLDMNAVCDELEEEGNTRISRTLGVAKFSIGRSEITLYRSGKMDLSARLKWYLRKASRLTRYVKTVRVVDEYSMFSRMTPHDEWGKKIIRDIRIADFLGFYRMIHVTL